MTRRFPQEITDGYMKVSTSNVSDACDRLSINGAVTGILPIYPCAKIVGHAATLKMAKPKDGVKESVVPATFNLIERSGAGAILVIDSQDNPTVNCLGGITGAAIKHNGLVGCVAHGIMRDVDEYKGYGLAVYGTGITQQSIRGRSIVAGVDVPVKLGDVTCNPDDLVFADDNGVVVVPKARAAEVLSIALVIKATEDRVIAAIRSGVKAVEAMDSANYDNLNKPQKN
jgi:4-hydroxy-4-methyl-2-oxoglutarate aldolase